MVPCYHTIQGNFFSKSKSIKISQGTGTMLLETLLKQGHTKKEVAKMAGVSQAAVSKWASRRKGIIPFCSAMRIYAKLNTGINPP